MILATGWARTGCVTLRGVLVCCCECKQWWRPYERVVPVDLVAFSCEPCNTVRSTCHSGVCGLHFRWGPAPSRQARGGTMRGDEHEAIWTQISGWIDRLARRRRNLRLKQLRRTRVLRGRLA